MWSYRNQTPETVTLAAMLNAPEIHCVVANDPGSLGHFFSCSCTCTSHGDWIESGQQMKLVRVNQMFLKWLQQSHWS